MAEYFVRSPDSENARGPFSLEKLQSLAEVGQIDKQSLCYDHATESWKPIGENEELCAQLFPQKKKLTLRKKTPQTSPKISSGKPEAKSSPSEPGAKPQPAPEVKSTKDSGGPSPEAAPIPAPGVPPTDPKTNTPSGMNVEDIIEAAEGNTEHLRVQMEEKAWKDRAAALSLPMLSGLMLLSGVSLVAGRSLVLYKLLIKGWGSHLFKIFEEPMLLLGGIDIFLAIVIALAVTSVYPLIRLRLMIGLGYLGWLSIAEWLAGGELGIFQLLALVVFTFGAYICTITIRFSTLLLAGLCALTGVTALGLILNYPELFL